MITKPARLSLEFLSPSPFDDVHMTQRNTFFSLSLFLVTLFPSAEGKL